MTGNDGVVTGASDAEGLIASALARRSAAWRDRDRGHAVADEIGQLASRSAGNGDTDAVSVLTDGSDPNAELDVVLAAMNQELSSVAQQRAEIQTCEASIAAIKRRQMITIVAAIVIPIVIALIVIIALVSA